MKEVAIEEAWGVLRNEGYHNQFEGGWEPLHDDVTVVGRALTVQYMPNRPDVSDQIKKKGKADGQIGNTNSWPIDMLQLGDVYVADGFWKNCAVKHGNTLYIAGKGAHVEPYEIKAHTEICIAGASKGLEANGSSMEQVLKVNVYLGRSCRLLKV
ncbi:hypothetical protein GQR58_026390 [Nymphon striatum]|nr:hypothetical protein GQR58_026390 [Nymphon striatum]